MTKLKLKEDFTCYYLGEKQVLKAGATVEGWIAGRAKAKGVTAPIRNTKKKEEISDESESDAS